MAPGRKPYGVNRLKEDLKHHLKLKVSFNSVRKQIEIELLWKDDPAVPDHVEKPKVIAYDSVDTFEFLREYEKSVPGHDWGMI